MPRKKKLDRSELAKAAWRKRKAMQTAGKYPKQLDRNGDPMPDTDMGQEDPVVEMQGRLNKSISYNRYLKSKVALQKELLIRAQRAMLVMLDPVNVPFQDN